ncbi:hypothetical protein HPP92_006680 [Vanilla planifolia]|uniref:Pentatricopeptide repeat-containing protein n=2 Tax=Vanilla planifolia TaxID=51239 RepID=A0A835V8X0_VANPL|nr:hypothetical protein HPP92_006680 [Vanilla planifolia]
MRSLSLPLSSSTFAAIISSYADACLPDLAVEVFNRMRHFSCSQTTEVYNALLSALSRSRNFHGAYALVRRMHRRSVPPDRRTFSILVDAWCASGSYAKLRIFSKRWHASVSHLPFVAATFSSTASSAPAISNPPSASALPDVSTFNGLLAAICDAGEVDFCVDLLRDANDLGLCPDISTYKTLIPAVSKAGRIEEAFSILNCAMEEGHRPFPSLYAAIVKAMCRAGRFADAFAFFGEMKTRGHPPNRPVYTMLVKMCVRGGRIVEAANFLVEMTEVGMTPRSQSFDMVVEGLKHSGKHDLARRMEMLEVDLRG